MKLLNPTNDQLNEWFALKVCRLTKNTYFGDCGFDVYERERIEWVDKKTGLVAYRDDRLPWVDSLDAAIGRIGDFSLVIERIPEWPVEWQAQVSDDDHCWIGRAATPAKALVIALLHSRGIETPDLDKP